MKKITTIVLISLLNLFITFSALANSADYQTEVKTLSLAGDIIDRQPKFEFTNNLTCDNEAASVEIEAENEDVVYLWNRISNNKKRAIVHNWQQNVDDTWVDRASIVLNIGVSQGWRSWSSKNLDQNHHLGTWRVVISPQDEPENVLCTVNFKVI